MIIKTPLDNAFAKLSSKFTKMMTGGSEIEQNTNVEFVSAIMRV